MLLYGGKLQVEVLRQVWEKTPSEEIFESFVKDSS